MKSVILIGALLSMIAAANGVVQATEYFNNPNYTYTRAWSATEEIGGTGVRWVAGAGTTLAWSDRKNHGYAATLNPTTGELSNVTQFSSDCYQVSLDPTGGNVTWITMNEKSSLTLTDGTTVVKGNVFYTYNVASQTTTTAFSVANLAPANYEAATAYRGQDLGWYGAAYGSANTTLMSLRGHANDLWDLYSYTAGSNNITRLTNSSEPSEYRPTIYGTDTDKILYWTEYQQSPGSVPRSVVIYDVSEGTSEVVAAGSGYQVTPVLAYMSCAWGNDSSTVLTSPASDTSWTKGDLWIYEKQGEDWVMTDLTGDAHDYDSDGFLNVGYMTAGGNVFFGGRHDLDPGFRGIWFAQQVPEPGMAVLLVVGAVALAFRRRRA
ncbi:MAG TPA: PEP-CTERM sorting domain-containing protein [Thermoguttaceae bacterium]|nr:PEP-CTERM sorting domain-containing protein [Thermoguttaceae bacterium]